MKLNNDHTTLMVISQENYLSRIIELMKETSKQNVCYVTLNKTCQNIIDTFKKNKINTENIKFIDGISRSIQDVNNTPDCTYLSSPEAVTELSLIISVHLKYPFDYLIIDSLTNLVTYTNQDTIIKLAKNIAGKIGKTECKAIFIALDIPEHQNLIKAIGAFADKVIKL